MQLNYHSERTIDGVRYQFAHPSTEFWVSWRKNKSALGDIGISLTEERDSLGQKVYTVVRASRPGQGDLPTIVKVPTYMIRDTSNLKHYQVGPVGDLVASLLSNGFALDGSDTGTGKTWTSLKTAILTGLQPAIICTKPGIHSWRVVCQFLGVNPVFICNWESCIGRIYKTNGVITKVTQPPNKYIKMSFDPFTGNPMFKWLIPPSAKVVIIFDELHKANGDESAMNKLVRAAKEQNYKIMGLSATICDKLAKLRTLGSLIGLFKYENFDLWLKEQGCYINQFNKWDATNEAEVMLKISKYLFPNFGARVKKDDVPGFPKCQNIARLYSIDKSELQNKKYEKLLKEVESIKNKKVTGGEFQILALRMKHRQLAESYKIPLLIELAREYVSSGHSVVLFTCFINTLETIAKKLNTTCVIKGGQKNAERIKNIEDFGADRERIIVTNIQAGGTSIDGLQDLKGMYSQVGLIPPTDNPVILKQSLGRINRSNSKSKSMNILVYSAGTVEERIFASVHNKLKNIDLLNDGDLADDVTFTKE